MENSYLIQLIKSINHDEWVDLKLFILSPCNNKGIFSKEVRALFILIESDSNNNSFESTDKKTIYSALFPEKPFVNGKIEKVMSELNKIIRAFLLSKHYFSEENEFNQNFDLAKILRARNLENRYQPVISRLETHLEKNKSSINNYLYKKYTLEHEKHDWECYYNKQKGDVNLPETIKSLDLFYYTNRVEYLNFFLLQKMSTKLETPEFINRLLADTNIPEYYLESSLTLNISNKIFLLLNSEKPEVKDFTALIRLINENENRIDATSLRNFCAYLRNICVILYHSGMSEFAPVLFKLQKEHLEKGYLYYEGKLHISTYYSVVNNSIRQKEFEWVIKFIENYKNLLIGENESKDYYRLNLARYFTATKQFNEAKDILPQSFVEPMYNNLARRLELIIYYETNSTLLSYKIDSFKMFILRSSRKYLPSSERESQTNFINLLFQLTQSPQKDRNRSERLIKRINNKKLVADREWLLEKAVELGKKK